MVTNWLFQNNGGAMRKVLAVVVAMVLMASVAFGAQVQKEIIDETLSISNAAGEADINISDSKRVSFFATIDNNRTTAAVTAVVTAAYSLNGTDWTDISWMDVAGGVTPQTSETTASAEQTYVGWLDNRGIAKYLRIRVYSVELDKNYDSRFTSADNATLSVTVVQDK
jgi:opacity protein-like surface antigen